MYMSINDGTNGITLLLSQACLSPTADLLFCRISYLTCHILTSTSPRHCTPPTGVRPKLSSHRERLHPLSCIIVFLTAGTTADPEKSLSLPRPLLGAGVWHHTRKCLQFLASRALRCQFCPCQLSDSRLHSLAASPSGHSSRLLSLLQSNPNTSGRGYPCCNIQQVGHVPYHRVSITNTRQS